MNKKILFFVVFCSVNLASASEQSLELFQFSELSYKEHKKKLLSQGRGTFTAATRRRQEEILFVSPLEKALENVRNFLTEESSPLVKFFFSTPYDDGELPLQRFIKNHQNSSSFDVKEREKLVLEILQCEKIHPLKLLSEVGDAAGSESLIVLLSKSSSLEFMDQLLTDIYENPSFGGEKAIEKLLAIESVLERKTVARFLAEKLLSFSHETWQGLDFLIGLNKKLLFLRTSLNEDIALFWFKFLLSQKEIAQVLIEYIKKTGNTSQYLDDKKFKAEVYRYLKELFSVLWPYTVYVLTTQSKETQEQVISTLIKYKIFKPLVDFLVNFNSDQKKYARILLETPNQIGAPLLYQAVESQEKGLVLAVLLLGKQFLDELVVQSTYAQDTVVHLASRKGEYEFFSALMPLLAERKKLGVFFKLFMEKGSDGKTPMKNFLQQAQFSLIRSVRGSSSAANIEKNVFANKDFLEKLHKYYAGFFKKTLTKNTSLHQACIKDDPDLVSFILKATEGRGKNKVASSALLVGYDKKGRTPAILSIEHESLCALRSLLLYAYEKHMLRKMLEQKDKQLEHDVHFTAFQHAMLRPISNESYDEIMKFLRDKKLRNLFNFLLKSKASNKKTTEQLVPDEKRVLLNLHKQLSWSLSDKSIKNQSSLTTFTPTTCVKDVHHDKNVAPMYGAPVRLVQSFAGFSNETHLVKFDLTKEVFEI